MVRPHVTIFGIRIADFTMAETLTAIDDFVREGRRTGRTHQIATVNVDFLVNALEDDGVARILRGADLSVADGMPVVWGARLLGTPLRERVAGADLVPLLVARSELTGWRIHIIGSTPSVALASEQLLAQRFPDARVSIDPSPIVTSVGETDESVIARIEGTGADILCVALGNPKQEYFIHKYRGVLGIPVLIGIGGSLDLLVGERRRAPRWMQRVGMEWVARAAQEPVRLSGRYAHDVRVFVPAFAREWLVRRRSGGSTV